MNVEDHGFIVTGAGSGLGAATARDLAARGARVVVVDLNAQAADAVADELGPHACAVQADVAHATDAQNVIRRAVDFCRELRGLVNCAGVAPAEKVVSKEGAHSLETFSRTVHINLIGTFNMLRLAAVAMSETTPMEDGERGVIINTASVAAFDGQVGQAAYAASKGGVIAMTLPIARELARHGIRVMSIAPGIMGTPMLKAMPIEVQDALGKTVPFPPRMGRPEEFAGLVAHIVENGYLNGEVIRLDGAIRMAAR